MIEVWTIMIISKLRILEWIILRDEKVQGKKQRLGN